MTLAASTPAPPPSALDHLTAHLSDDLAAVNDQIVARMDSPVALIPQLARYIVASGGKRLRPLLTLATARLCGYGGTRHIGLAAAVEFIHTATLLHDDVVDESELRRGQESANALFGNKPSVLVGDFLFARAFQLMTQDGSIDVLRTLSRASAVISEGEVLQLSSAGDLATDRQTYLDVINAKTAELFAAACRVGGIVADAGPAACDALDHYGRSLGMAFQVVDDVLDYSAEQAKLGKTVGDDFAEGKITLPVIIAFARGDDREQGFWRRVIEGGEQRDGDLAFAQELLRRHGALDESIAFARDQGDTALAQLAALPQGPFSDHLSDLVAFCVERDY